MVRILAIASVVCLATSALAQSVREGAATVVFTNQTLTASYVASDSIDLKSYDSAVVLIEVPTNQASKTANVKFEWSNDGTTFVPEYALNPGTIASGDQPYTPVQKRVDVDMASGTTSAPYIERVRRLARYFRIKVKSDGVTTGTVKGSVVPMNNEN